jgi:C4-dicarboxylate-specific signal transduction histidine kinase
MLRQVEKRYYDSYMPGGFSLWQWGREEARQARDAQHEVAQRKDDIAACRKTLEDEMRRHAKAIDATRSATVSSVQGKLPAVFQAVAAYSASLAHALDAVSRPAHNAPTQ